MSQRASGTRKQSRTLLTRLCGLHLLVLQTPAAEGDVHVVAAGTAPQLPSPSLPWPAPARGAVQVRHLQPYLLLYLRQQ